MERKGKGWDGKERKKKGKERKGTERVSASSAPPEKITSSHHIAHHLRPQNPIIPTHGFCKTSRLWQFHPPSPHFDTSSAPTPTTSFPPTPAYSKVLLHHRAGTHDAYTPSHMAQHIGP